MEVLQLRNNNIAKETFQGNRYGILNPDRWDESSCWLAEGQLVADIGLDSSLRQPSMDER
jgi:hypothetical protein